MWRIVDHTGGRLRAALEKEWDAGTASNVLERSHHFGAATDIAHELLWLGFESDKDFAVHPAGGDIARSLVTDN
ncbi:MAG TPA: hypothetical protein VLI39_14055 [Sedimentisphaerales bacterium]|nr:hypothetical protein [Sedimentisphaerales bacterium]